MTSILMASSGYDSMLIANLWSDVINRYVYVDYGNVTREREIATLRAAGIQPEVLSTHSIGRDRRGFYYGRNLHLILTVREAFPGDDILVYFGTTATDNFSDNSREFLYRVEGVLNDSYPKAIRIVCPLHEMTKREVIQQCQFRGIDAYYCDEGGEEPCGKCHSCEAVAEAMHHGARHEQPRERGTPQGVAMSRIAPATRPSQGERSHRGNL